MPLASLSRLFARLTRSLCGGRSPQLMRRWNNRPRPVTEADDPVGTLQPAWRQQVSGDAEAAGRVTSAGPHECGHYKRS